jgi:F0F1-type ATP synthase assembly protein I
LDDQRGPDHQVENAKIVGLATALGFSVVASLIFFIVLGIVLDQWLDTTPLFTLIGVGLGLVGAGYQLYELILVSDSKRENGPIGRTMAQRIGAKQRHKM